VVAFALWLFGAAPAKGAINSAPIIDVPEVASKPQSPIQAQAPITIPYGKAPVTLDGNCREYTDGVLYTFSELPGTTGRVYLKHDNSNLFVCLEGVPGERADRFASVYLDTDNGREPIAQSDDKSLRVNITNGITKSLQGSGVPNGYVSATLPGWTAAATHTANGDSAEYSIPLLLTGGGCNRDFGLSVFHHWLRFVGDDFGWPAGSIFDQPQTWQEVKLDSFPCGRGKIAYVFKRDTATAADFKNLLQIEGYSVDLIPLSVVTTTLFGGYDLIIIADDRQRPVGNRRGTDCADHDSRQTDPRPGRRWLCLLRQGRLVPRLAQRLAWTTRTGAVRQSSSDLLPHAV
jgi:hypothetical protein